MIRSAMITCSRMVTTAVLILVMTGSPATAGFTLVNPPGGSEADHAEILECIYGSGFAPVGERDYETMSLGIVVTRVPDFVGEDPLALGDNLDISAPSPSATDQIWADGEVLAAVRARFAS